MIGSRRRGRSWPVVLVACSTVLAACRGEGAKKSRRTGSAAPVEVIAQPQLPDAGAGPGPSADELEPNDGDDVATPIALGGTARGRIEPDTDVDHYRLEVDKAGVLQVMLTGVDGVDLQLELVDATGSSLGRSDRTGARIKEGIPNAGVTPGRYTLVVKHAPKKKAARSRPKKGSKTPEAEAEAPPVAAPVYELSAQLVALPAGAEREPDDDRGTANDLIIADNATGFVGWSGDADVWKLSVETLSEKNTLDVEVSAIEGVALSLEVADGVGTVLATRKAARGQPVVLRSLMPVVPEGAPPFHYLTVRGDRSNPETAYTLHARAQIVGPDPELEPNDAVDRAQLIPSDRTVVHASWTPGDVDHFALAPAEGPRTVGVSVDTPAELDLGIELLVDGKPIATANKGGKGVVESLSAAVPAGVTAVIRVKNIDANATAAAAYDVMVTESTATGDNAP